MRYLHSGVAAGQVEISTPGKIQTLRSFGQEFQVHAEQGRWALTAPDRGEMESQVFHFLINQLPLCICKWFSQHEAFSPQLFLLPPYNLVMKSPSKVIEGVFQLSCVCWQWAATVLLVPTYLCSFPPASPHLTAPLTPPPRPQSGGGVYVSSPWSGLALRLALARKCGGSDSVPSWGLKGPCMHEMFLQDSAQPPWQGTDSLLAVPRHANYHPTGGQKLWRSREANTLGMFMCVGHTQVFRTIELVCTHTCAPLSISELSCNDDSILHEGVLTSQTGKLRQTSPVTLELHYEERQ